MKKVLVVASVASMIDQFNRDNILILRKLNCEVHVGANFQNSGTIDSNRTKELKKFLNDNNVIIHDITFSRSFFSLNKHIKSYKILKKIIRNNNIDIVHCHSPIVGAIVRVLRKKEFFKVIYTAHGFHFYEGAPIKNWIIFYPIEKYLSKYTDTLITINQYDYRISSQKFSAKKVKYIPSIGLDIHKINELVKSAKGREELGIPIKQIVLISVGEINDNKNHKSVIKALSSLRNIDYTYIICGVGMTSYENELKELAKSLGLENKVKFLGYTKNVIEYLNNSDIFIFPSKREGLGMAALEAMAVGLPIINTYVGGMKEYTQNGKTGVTLENPEDIESIASAITKITDLSKSEIDSISRYNNIISTNFDKENVNKLMEKIYFQVLNEENK